jgi:hypothetical protein
MTRSGQAPLGKTQTSPGAQGVPYLLEHGAHAFDAARRRHFYEAEDARYRIEQRTVVVVLVHEEAYEARGAAAYQEAVDEGHVVGDQQRRAALR